MKVKSIIPLVLLAFIWGGYYVVSHIALEHMSVFTVGIVIRFITFIVLTIIMYRKKELKSLLQVQGILKRLVLIGTLGFLLDITAFIGLSLSPAGSGTALLKCDILFVNLISVVIYKQKFTKFEWLYTFVMLFGVLKVLDINLSNLKLGNKGDIFFILSALFISINAFVIKSVQKDKHNPAKDNVVAYYNNFFTMTFFTITALIMGDIGQLKLIGSDLSLALALLLAGLGQTGVYIVYYYDLRRFPVWIVKVFLLLMPVVASVLSFLLFKEVMNTGQYIGIAIVLLGAFGIVVEQRKKEIHVLQQQI
jgi:drug/metabolite transporter (DMT)-like permease